MQYDYGTQHSGFLFDFDAQLACIIIYVELPVPVSGAVQHKRQGRFWPTVQWPYALL